MPLREARFSDHATLAAVCSAAFFDEALFGQLMHPRRHAYPDDPAVFWHCLIRKQWYDWRNRFIVAVTPRNKIVGVAIWQRQGEGGNQMLPHTLDPRNLLGPFIRASNQMNSLLYRNRALDSSKVNVLGDSMPYCAHHWSGERAENWYLSLCAVHPDYHGKGFGRELVAWGLRRAEEGGLHASVMSSEGNEGFYLRCGFEEIVGNATEGEGNPLAGVAGGAILFKYPRSTSVSSRGPSSHALGSAVFLPQ